MAMACISKTTYKKNYMKMPSNFTLSIAQAIQRNVHRKPISNQGAPFGAI